MPTIVVIDDEEDILELLDYNLTLSGFKVILKQDGPGGLDSIRSHRPDLIILDLMLPGLNGLDVCRIVKNDCELSHIPIVMLTVKGEEKDIVTGFELGADDYITKPFSIHVLIARVRAVLRKKLGETGYLIETVRGVGYRLRSENEKK
jgi:DNA-binding response OmpR family regulator